MLKRVIAKTECTFKNKFITKAGNGKAVPQYELKDGKVVPVINKATGEIITHNLYADIQKNAKANDYKRILEMGGDPLMFASTTDQVVDTTQMGSGVDLLNAQRNAEAHGYKDFNDLLAKFNAFVKQQQEQEAKKQVQQKEKKEEEKK